MSLDQILQEMADQITLLRDQVRDLITQEAPDITESGVFYGGPDGETNQESANFHYNDGTDTLTVPHLVASNSITADTLEANIITSGGLDLLTEGKYRHAQLALMWGTPITLDASYNLKWTSRIIAMPVDRSISSNGYIEIVMPSVGVTITGVGGASNKVVSASGISLSTWTALIVEHTVGGVYNAVTLKLVSYTSAILGGWPPNWIILAVRSGDQAMVLIPGAGAIFPGETFAGNRLQDVGSAFPAIWSTNKPFYHTTYQMWYNYDGTHWLTPWQNTPMIPYTLVLPYPAASITTTVVYFAPYIFSQDIKGIYASVAFRVSTTHDAANYYTVSIDHVIQTTGTVTNLGSFSTRLNSVAAGVFDAYYLNHSTILVNKSPEKIAYIRITCTKTGAPGDLVVAPAVKVRYVGV